jgi:hypothetical protein
LLHFEERGERKEERGERREERGERREERGKDATQQLLILSFPLSSLLSPRPFFS